MQSQGLCFSNILNFRVRVTLTPVQCHSEEGMRGEHRDLAGGAGAQFGFPAPAVASSCQAPGADAVTSQPHTPPLSLPQRSSAPLIRVLLISLAAGKARGADPGLTGTWSLIPNPCGQPYKLPDVM